MILTRTFKNEDGSVSAWIYDSKISTVNPVEVIEDYTPGEESPTFKIEKTKVKKPTSTKPLPRTKQKYLNPKTGKMVGYVRAKNLGII